MSGNLSLDFANTAGWHAGPDPQERLTSYACAVDWALVHGILSHEQAEGLLPKARARFGAESGVKAGAEAGATEAGAEAGATEAEALSRVIAFREAVYRVFSAVAHSRIPESADLEVLDRVSREAAGHLWLIPAPLEPDGPASSVSAVPGGRPRFVWTWVGLEEELTGFLWPVARAATELLTSKQLVQVRECAGDPCGWLFLDLTKNGSRRWCDMADCGNRAKARRYRERRKGTASVYASSAAPGSRAGGDGAVSS